MKVAGFIFAWLRKSYLFVKVVPAKLLVLGRWTGCSSRRTCWHWLVDINRSLELQLWSESGYISRRD